MVKIMEKIIRIRKSSDFSEGSSVYLFINDEKTHLKSYDYYEVKITNTDVVYAKHQWVKTKRFIFSKLDNNATYEIVPLLGRKFGFIFIVVVSLCLVLFFVTKQWWYSIPIGIMGGYILMALSILSNRYLRLRKT